MEPTDEQIIKAIGRPYHCVDCLDLNDSDSQEEGFGKSIDQLRALFTPVIQSMSFGTEAPTTVQCDPDTTPEQMMRIARVIAETTGKGVLFVPNTRKQP